MLDIPVVTRHFSNRTREEYAKERQYYSMVDSRLVLIIPIPSDCIKRPLSELRWLLKESLNVNKQNKEGAPGEGESRGLENSSRAFPLLRFHGS